MQDWLSAQTLHNAQRIADAELDAQLTRESIPDEIDKACRQWKIRDAKMQELLHKTQELLSQIDLSTKSAWHDWLFRRDVLLEQIAALLKKSDCPGGGTT